MTDLDELIAIIKQQAELFLLDVGEFFPFGTYINDHNEVIPCSAYLETENDQPKSSDLIEILKGFFIKGIENGNVLIGAIVLDVYMHENGRMLDGMQIRFFEKGKEYFQTFRYIINKDSVDFMLVNP